MNSGQTRVRLVKAGAVLAAVALVAGCGSQYRPVITPINPSGPAAQPSSLAIVVSAPSPTTAGVATVIDYSGDTVMATAPVGKGPTSFSLDASGTTGYTVNSDGTVTNFPATTSLQAKSVLYTTLPASAQTTSMFSPQSGLWTADQCSVVDGHCTSVVDVFTPTSGVETFKLSIPVSATPVMIIGPASGQRNYALTLNNAQTPTANAISYQDMTCNNSPSAITQTGEADSLENTPPTVSARIPLGKCPVYAVQTPDNKRLFVLNRGDDTITVINTQNNTTDGNFDADGHCIPFQNRSGQWVTCHPTLPLSLTAVNALNAANPGSGNPPNGTAGMLSVAGPVFAEYNAAKNKLIVADYDGGTISIIDVTLDEYGNDSNTYANPSCTVDGVNSFANCGAITGGFGTTYTVKVGKDPAVAPYPASVTVLADGSRAYTANQGEGTVTVVNLSAYNVVTTLPVTGHPRTVVSTSNSLYGKVYVASPDSPYLTIVRTDQDIVDTTVLVQGNILDVRVNSIDGSGSNNNTVSRKPGVGQPCYLAPNDSRMTTAPDLETCQTLPLQ